MYGIRLLGELWLSSRRRRRGNLPEALRLGDSIDSPSTPEDKNIFQEFAIQYTVCNVLHEANLDSFNSSREQKRMPKGQSMAFPYEGGGWIRTPKGEMAHSDALIQRGP
ncbi:hypothetical protein G5I_06952 [Acromyrmex echinatior]|uniref:Uncharacterized protein n=1 Tax=Acromyrmex echinatior TaxID=103372 RepID=F4WMB8_ACREC|nr:hypothetical protein G5I_06952 [Acromyrmex echinatior]